MPRKPKEMKSDVKPTTTQSLGSLLKSARDIMRKDKGLNGDLDRLPLLTWIMFLKFLDDLEIQREEEAKLAGKAFRPAIDAPYRWRDWAANLQGVTGDELLAFINQDEAVLPSGKRGPGLFAYLRQLTSSNGDNRRDVIATVFRGVDNRMKSGYLLRDVINKVAGIHFTSSEELHTLGALYESMLREMRDAAGDSGEFYTPRAVVRFMVEVTDPRLGETVLDPAAGTGGFLVESFNHLSKQVKTVADRKRLQQASILGCEPKPLPYLLCQMNLLLHGLDAPQIDPGNSLRFKLSEIGEKDRVDAILTNPPFGGEEEKGIQGNFPQDGQTAETALLFMQLVMRKLRRQAKNGFGPSRAAVVVSDGFLSTKGVASRIKERLCKEFNLHTIVRLPRGVFVPYTPIATNILFFDQSAKTEKIWYYEVPGPTDRQTYSKTKPFRYEEFSECLKWWHSRKENVFAWQVPIDDVIARDYDLDVLNPNGGATIASKDPATLIDTINRTSNVIATHSNRITKLFSPDSFVALSKEGLKPLSEFITLRKQFSVIADESIYKLITVQLHARGISLRGEKPGSDIKTKKQQFVRTGDFVVAEIDAKMGGYGIVPLEGDGAIVSSHYFVYEIDETRLDPRFFEWWLRSGIPEKLIQPYVKGSTNYAAIRQHHFPLLELRVPPIEIQKELVKELDQLSSEVKALDSLRAELAAESGALMPSILRGAFEN